MAAVDQAARNEAIEDAEIGDALAKLVPPEEKLGEAMLGLNEKQRVFVIAVVVFGCANNHTRAARLAGYEGTLNSLRVQAHRLAHNPKVQAALLEEARKRFQAGTVAAVDVAMEFLADTKADPRVRLKAAELVMDRGGLPKATEHRVVSSYEPTREEKLLELVSLARALGQDPRTFLGNLADVVEADFKLLKLEPAKDGVLEPAGGAAG